MRELARALLEWPQQAIETLAAHGQFPDHPDTIAVQMYQELLSYLEEHATAMSEEARRLVSAPLPVKYLHDYGSRASLEEHRRALVADGMSYFPGLSLELRRLQDNVSAMERFLTKQIQQDRKQAAKQLIKEVQ